MPGVLPWGLARRGVVRPTRLHSAEQQSGMGEWLWRVRLSLQQFTLVTCRCCRGIASCLATHYRIRRYGQLRTPASNTTAQYQQLLARPQHDGWYRRRENNDWRPMSMKLVQEGLDLRLRRGEGNGPRCPCLSLSLSCPPTAAAAHHTSDALPF